MLQVLIVDDDIATVDVICEKTNWEQLGIEKVFKAYNIQQAKEILNENDIPIIVSDIEMPQGSGIDLLEWYRDQGRAGEFILLTCHERFDYATNALKLQAAEYLLKPFDVNIMEAAIRKAVYKVIESRKIKEHIEYGQWAKSNHRQLQQDFIRMAIEDRLKGKIEEEIINRRLNLSADSDYRLIISRATEVDKDLVKMDTGLFSFVLQNVHSEVLCGNPENRNVVCWDAGDSYILVTLCENVSKEEIESKAKELLFQHKKLLSSTLTICISRVVKIADFSNTYDSCIRRINSSVKYYGNIFFEEETRDDTDNKGILGYINIFDSSVMEDYLDAKDRAKAMGYLKKALNDFVAGQTLDNQLLKNAAQEIWDSVYRYSGRHGYSLTGFFKDDVAVSMENNATRSVMDFLRWANYLLEQLFDYVEKEKNSLLPVEKIKQYISLHYMENIGRTEIAAELGLAPEYISKLFKKETGVNLSDYLARYRVEQAKLLLDRKELSISEISEATGFENSTYFSTTFKKYTNMTPNQFRKQ